MQVAVRGAGEGGKGRGLEAWPGVGVAAVTDILTF